jgi:hypothetical protein
VALAAAAVAAASDAHAKSLTDALNQLSTFGGVQVPVPSTTAAVISLQRNAVRSADFVAAAATPGFAYEYDPELGAFVRSTSSRGAVFVESPLTLTRGHVDVGVSYFYSKLTELDGDSLTGTFTNLRFLSEGGLDSTFFSEIDQFDLYSQALSVYATYGVTSNLDVNILVPLFLTELHLRGSKRLVVESVPNEEVIREDETAFGVGDIIVRGKYRLPSAASADFATLLALRLPSGDQDNFQGLGDVVVTPLLAMGRTLGPHEVHANLGVDANSDDLHRSRVRYAAGASFRVLSPLSLLVDVIGSSGVSDDHFVVRGASGSVDRTDIVDVAIGLKLAVGDRFIGNLGVIRQLTDDGLTADVIPTAGFELTF